MKLSYTTANNRITAEFEADTHRELFTQISKFQEVFEESKCGKCGSENLKFVVRTVDDNEYFELRCADCGAKLAFGSMKKGGGLFPKRKDADGNWLPDGGWTKWNPKTKTAE
tara:strand:+ start:298 stop:633 length:336 start_codon:yes stop_codon:yes gene_type:complete